MALLPNLMELFRTPAPAAPLTAAQRAAAGNNNDGSNPAGNLPGPDNNNTVPSGNTPASDGSIKAIPAAGEGEASPLSQYQKMWEAPSGAPNPADLVPAINADPAKMLEAARTIDFTKQMDPALLEAASKGDAGALAKIINSSAQNGYAAAAGATVNIVKAALGEQAKQFENKYAPAMLRRSDIQGAVTESVSLANDPAAAPIISALTAQLSNSFPQATATEISAHVSNYMKEFSQKVVEANGGKIQSREDLALRPGGSLSRTEPDWESYFAA